MAPGRVVAECTNGTTLDHAVDRERLEAKTRRLYSDRMTPKVADACPVCRGRTNVLGSVDFNKSCEEARGKHLPPAGTSWAGAVTPAARKIRLPSQ